MIRFSIARLLRPSAWFRLLRLLGTALGSAAVLCAADSVASDSPDAVLYPRASAGAAAVAGHDGWSRLPWLAGALLLAAAGLWWLWQNRARSGAPRRGGRQLAIEETHSLGNRQYLVVAAYRDKKLLLGVTSGRIKLLCDLSADEEVEA